VDRQKPVQAPNRCTCSPHAGTCWSRASTTKKEGRGRRRPAGDSAGRLRPLHPPPNNPPVKVSVGAGCVERDDRERDDVPACPYRAQGMRRNSNDRVEEHVMTNSAALFSFATHTHYCFCVRQKQSALIFLASFPPSFLHSSLIPSMDLGKMMCLFGASDVEGHASGIARLQHKSWCMRMT